MTIDEQLRWLKQAAAGAGVVPPPGYKTMCDAMTASLERLKRIDAVQVPDQPTVWAGGFAGPQVDKKDYDTLRDLLRRVSVERDACAQTNDDQSRRVFAAEAKLAETNRLLVEAQTDAERCALLSKHWEADDKEKFCALIAEIRKEQK
jgi:hypothetical protein